MDPLPSLAVEDLPTTTAADPRPRQSGSRTSADHGVDDVLHSDLSDLSGRAIADLDDARRQALPTTTDVGMPSSSASLNFTPGETLGRSS